MIEQLLAQRQMSYRQWLSMEQYIGQIRGQVNVPWMFFANQLWTKEVPILWCPWVDE